jgi:phosphoglycerate dehydrogenase-like enzyme
MDTEAKRIVFVANFVGPELESAATTAYPGIVEFMQPEDLVLCAHEIDAVMALDRPLPLEFLARADRLVWVHSQSHGYYNLLSPEMEAHPATVTNSRGAHPESVSEHVFAMLLGLMRHLAEYMSYQTEHKWQRVTMDTLYGKTMCVIGVGNIGSAIARRAKGFGMRVVGVDIVPIVCDAVDELVGLERLDGALSSADVVSISVPYTNQTAGMFDSRRLHMMKKGAYLINTARGGIVDETTLVDMLKSGRLAGAGFDVFSAEPLPAGSPLWDAPNTILLPHSASQTALSRRRVMEIAIENIRRFLSGEPLLNIVKNGRAG